MSARLDYVNVDFIDSVMAENTRLKELNREMVGMLEDVLYYELPSDVYATIKELLAKAEGRGE